MEKPKEPITFFDTYIDASAKTRVDAVLDSGRLSEGALVREFETALLTLGLSHSIAVNSGTSALHIALVAAGITTGDEVILPAQTFVASGLTIVQQGAIPVFADIEYETGNISPESVRAKITPRTKAIMVVHWGGLPVDLDEIHNIAQEHGLIVIEDAAHAIGATYKDRPIGSLSDFTCFSFQAIKHLTTGDGGAVASLTPEAANTIRTLRWFGIDRAKAMPSNLGERIYNLEALGFKYHMNDYAAALGLANLPSVKERVAKRNDIATRYREGLKNMSGATLFDAPADRVSAHWLFGMHVEGRDNFIKMLEAAHIPTSVVHVGIDRNNIFGEGEREDLVNQRRFDATQIHIPMHDKITPEIADYIIDVIKKGW